MHRRELLQQTAGWIAAFACGRLGNASDLSPAARPPILDAHIHLFDPTRPGGVPWPEKDDAALYQPALPERYASLAVPFGVIGAIAVEASPLAADNDWLLAVAARHPFITGVIGNLLPGAPSFAADLDRLHRNPLFLGLRYGNLWGRDLAADLGKPGFAGGLQALARAGLVFESANPDPRLIRALVEVSSRVPGLRIIVDHLPHAQEPTGHAALLEYRKNLRLLAQNPAVYVKLSEIPVAGEGGLVKDPAFYRARLDALWDLFGEDRVVFGSDWPNSDHVATFADTMAVVRQYMESKPPAARAKYFAKNSAAVYRWRPRLPAQSLA